MYRSRNRASHRRGEAVCCCLSRAGILDTRPRRACWSFLPLAPYSKNQKARQHAEGQRDGLTYCSRQSNTTTSTTPYPLLYPTNHPQFPDPDPELHLTFSLLSHSLPRETYVDRTRSVLSFKCPTRPGVNVVDVRRSKSLIGGACRPGSDSEWHTSTTVVKPGPRPREVFGSVRNTPCSRMLRDVGRDWKVLNMKNTHHDKRHIPYYWGTNMTRQTQHPLHSTAVKM